MRTTMRFFFSLLALALFPVTVLGGGTLELAGQNAWTLYVFGNGEVIKNLLDATGGLTREAGYRNLLTFIAIIGVVGGAVAAGFNPKTAPKVVGYFLGAYFSVYAMFSVDVNIAIEDPVTSYYAVAENVPAPVGVPAALISQVGHWMTTALEKHFTTVGLPHQLTLSAGGGFNLATSLVRDAAQIRIIDPYLKQSISNYVTDCVFPDLVLGTISTSSTLGAPDMWQMMGNPNPALSTIIYGPDDPQGLLKGCEVAYTELTATLTAHAPELLEAASGSWGNSAALSFVSGAVQSAYTWLSDGTMNGSAASTVQQAAVIHQFNDSFQDAAAVTGNNEMMLAISVAQAKQSQKTSWYTTAKLFQEMVGYIYSILQAFIFAVVPILIAMFIPGLGKSIGKNYLQLLLWLVLWEPTLAIVNYIIALYAQQGMSGVFNYGGGAGSGLTAGNIGVVSEQTTNFMTAAAFMATMVPMITWGIVKGGMAFTEFLSGGLGSSFAKSAGQQAASGSVSLDNMSMGGRSLGQENLRPQTTVGYGVTNASLGAGKGMVQSSHGGEGADVNGQNITASTTVTRQLSSSQVAQNVARVSQSNTKALTDMKTEQASTQEQQASQLGELMSNSSGLSAEQRESAQDQWASSKAAELQSLFKEGTSHKEMMQNSARLSKELAALKAGMDSNAFQGVVGKTFEHLKENGGKYAMAGLALAALAVPGGALVMAAGRGAMALGGSKVAASALSAVASTALGKSVMAAAGAVGAKAGAATGVLTGGAAAAGFGKVARGVANRVNGELATGSADESVTDGTNSQKFEQQNKEDSSATLMRARAEVQARSNSISSNEQLIKSHGNSKTQSRSEQLTDQATAAIDRSYSEVEQAANTRTETVTVQGSTAEIAGRMVGVANRSDARGTVDGAPNFNKPPSNAAVRDAKAAMLNLTADQTDARAATGHAMEANTAKHGAAAGALTGKQAGMNTGLEQKADAVSNEVAGKRAAVTDAVTNQGADVAVKLKGMDEVNASSKDNIPSATHDLNSAVSANAPDPYGAPGTTQFVRTPPETTAPVAQRVDFVANASQAASEDYLKTLSQTERDEIYEELDPVDRARFSI